jgi:mannose-6-phosphate isomerase-like protein (cupin superfamily)
MAVRKLAYSCHTPVIPILEIEKPMKKSELFKAADVLAELPSPSSGDERYLEPFVDGSTSLGMYAPVGKDPQMPHDQDELYFVVSGNGIFVNDGKRSPFGPGDALFVAAGIEHRFEEFSEDFATWVVFWGPSKT